MDITPNIMTFNYEDAFFDITEKTNKYAPTQNVNKLKCLTNK